MHLITKGAAPAPPEMLRWELAGRYGWTLDYIDSLSVQNIHEFIQIRDARNKAKR